jgi:hypothetical protein
MPAINGQPRAVDARPADADRRGHQAGHPDHHVAQDNDPVGQRAARNLKLRALCVGIEPVLLTTTLRDLKEPAPPSVEALRATLRQQLRPEDASRFMALQPQPRPRALGRAGADKDQDR